jgi:hypothetical protein
MAVAVSGSGGLRAVLDPQPRPALQELNPATSLSSPAPRTLKEAVPEASPEKQGPQEAVDSGSGSPIGAQLGVVQGGDGSPPSSSCGGHGDSEVAAPTPATPLPASVPPWLGLAGPTADAARPTEPAIPRCGQTCVRARAIDGAGEIGGGGQLTVAEIGDLLAAMELPLHAAAVRASSMVEERGGGCRVADLGALWESRGLGFSAHRLKIAKRLACAVRAALERPCDAAAGRQDPRAGPRATPASH